MRLVLDFTFDRTINIDNVAGFSFFWDHWLDDFDLSVPVFNQMQHITFDNLGQITEWDFYYSNFNGLGETNEDYSAIYPNPTDGILFVQMVHAPSLPTQTYRITNLMGQTVLMGSLTAETQQIDVSALPQGMYFISVDDMTQKFVVNK